MREESPDSPRLGGGWVIHLEWRDGKLIFGTPESTDWQVVLVASSDENVFTIARGNNLSGEQVILRRLADSRVASVLLAETTWLRLDRAA
jgi:hypothetical protein